MHLYVRLTLEEFEIISVGIVERFVKKDQTTLNSRLLSAFMFQFYGIEL